MELQARSSNCFLWHVQKRAVHVVLRCDPVLYLMALHGRFQIGLYWLHNLGIWTWLGVLFYCTEGLDWVEEGVCSPFVIGVNRSQSARFLFDICAYVYIDIFGKFLICIYIYIKTQNYLALYSTHIAYIEIYSLNYSILYSVQYMEYNTETCVNNSAVTDVLTVLFRCMTPCRPVYF